MKQHQAAERRIEFNQQALVERIAVYEGLCSRQIIAVDNYARDPRQRRRCHAEGLLQQRRGHPQQEAPGRVEPPASVRRASGSDLKPGEVRITLRGLGGIGHAQHHARQSNRMIGVCEPARLPYHVARVVLAELNAAFRHGAWRHAHYGESRGGLAGCAAYLRRHLALQRHRCERLEPARGQPLKIVVWRLRAEGDQMHTRVTVDGGA